VQIEHVTRISFTARRTTQQQGDLAIRHSLLGQIVIHDQRVFTTVTEVLAHGAANERSQELHGSRLGSGSRHDDGVAHRAMLFQLAHYVGNRRLLLADGHVDTLNTGLLLVDDGVDRDSGLTNLTVADDQLTLTTTNRSHRVDRLQTGLYRLVNGLTPDNARSNFLHRVGQFGVDRALAIDRITQRVNNAAEQFRTNRNFKNAASTLGFRAFDNVQVVTENNGANGILFEVEGHPVDAAVKLDHFTVHHVGETVDANDTVGNGNYGTLGAGFSCGIKLADALLDDLADFGRVELLHAPIPQTLEFSCSTSLFSRPRTLPSITVSPARIRTPPIKDGSTCLLTRTSTPRRFFSAATRPDTSASSMGNADTSSTSANLLSAASS